MTHLERATSIVQSSNGCDLHATKGNSENKVTNLYVPFRILVIILREVPDVHYHRALDL